MKTKQRAEIATIILIVVGVLGATQIIPNWRVSNWFKKGPPTAELRAAEESAAKAKAELAALQAQLAAKQAAEDAAKTSQVQNAQFNVTGIPLALEGEAQTPGVVLATTLANNALLGLNSAIGGLPADQQAQIKLIVAQIRSSDLKQIEAGKAALAAKEAELGAVTSEREVLKAQIGPMQQLVKAADDKVQAANAIVLAKTDQVVTYADKAFAKEKEAGSLKALGDNLLKLLALVAVIAIGFAALWGWLKMHSVGIEGLKSAVTDIRAGVDPIHAIDTITTPRIQKKVAAFALPPTPKSP